MRSLPPLLLAGLLLLGLVACADPDPGAPAPTAAPGVERPALTTRADSVAMRAYEAAGGPEAWASVPLLRFDFASMRDGERAPARKHLWDRRSGDYRVEWMEGDSAYVALFNTDTQRGRVFIDGEAADSATTEAALQRAYRAFINDTYWLLAPLKMFDDGVSRTYVADSSGGDHDVVQLRFDGVGLTPGDTYWMYVDKDTGRLARWHFRLQSGNEGRYEWTDYETLEAPGGLLHLATAKQRTGSDFALLTDNVEVLERRRRNAFEAPDPLL